MSWIAISCFLVSCQTEGYRSFFYGGGILCYGTCGARDRHCVFLVFIFLFHFPNFLVFLQPVLLGSVFAFVTSSGRLSRLHVYNRECGNGPRHNGACGEVVGIVLHEDEPLITHWQKQLSSLLPVYILVKLSRTQASKLGRLDDFPVEPSSTTSTTKRGKKGPRTVQSRQFPITGAYAFTDYRSTIYWSTLLLHQGIHLVSSTFMLRYEEVLERIQFARSVILTMTSKCRLELLVRWILSCFQSHHCCGPTYPTMTIS